MPKDTHAVLPEDDSAVYEGRRNVLNRIDQEWQCDHVIAEAGSDGFYPVYCEMPEHDPFTARCWDHMNDDQKTGPM